MCNQAALLLQWVASLQMYLNSRLSEVACRLADETCMMYACTIEQTHADEQRQIRNKLRHAKLLLRSVFRLNNKLVYVSVSYFLEWDTSYKLQVYHWTWTWCATESNQAKPSFCVGQILILLVLVRTIKIKIKKKKSSELWLYMSVRGDAKQIV
jgi:hypothetical protein